MYNRIRMKCAILGLIVTMVLTTAVSFAGNAPLGPQTSTTMGPVKSAGQRSDIGPGTPLEQLAHILNHLKPYMTPKTGTSIKLSEFTLTAQHATGMVTFYFMRANQRGVGTVKVTIDPHRPPQDKPVDVAINDNDGLFTGGGNCVPPHECPRGSGTPLNRTISPSDNIHFVLESGIRLMSTTTQTPIVTKRLIYKNNWILFDVNKRTGEVTHVRMVHPTRELPDFKTIPYREVQPTQEQLDERDAQRRNYRGLGYIYVGQDSILGSSGGSVTIELYVKL